MKKQTFFFAFFLMLASTFTSNAVNPVGASGTWNALPAYSDEFDSPTVDLTKWDIDIASWSCWSWDKNLVSIVNKEMVIATQWNKHVRDGKTLYFKSGAARQKNTITQGYFEAKLKGPAYFPGLCPAFWMYSQRQSKDGIDYNEVDFCEPQQHTLNMKIIDTNTHYSLVGTDAWVDTKNVSTVTFDSNAGYHVYGCWVNGDKITFYIDGKLVATNNNGSKFILPMTIILSQGLRPNLMVYGADGSRNPVVFNSKPSGFLDKEVMKVQYVRVWTPGAGATAGGTAAVRIKGVSPEVTPEASLEVVPEVVSSKNIEVKPTSFTEASKVNYQVAKDGLVNITIFDLQGKEVLVLKNEIAKVGSYSVDLKAKSLKGAGVYICKLQTAGKVYSSKFILN